MKIPKLETAIDAVQGRVEGVVILDGRRPHADELAARHGLHLFDAETQRDIFRTERFDVCHFETPPLDGA